MPPEDAFKSPEQFWALLVAIQPSVWIALAAGLLIGWLVTILVIRGGEKRKGDRFVRTEAARELLRRKLDAHDRLRKCLHELSSGLTTYVGINNFAASRNIDSEGSRKTEAFLVLHIKIATLREAAESGAIFFPVAVQAAAQRLHGNYIDRIEQKSGTAEFDITYFTAKHRDLEQALEAEIRQIAANGYPALLKSA